VQYRFTWDPAKAASNRKKHGISFEEAITVFDDPLLVFAPDLEHGERRYVAVGVSSLERLLFVVSVEIDNDDLRIVTARKATTRERRYYEEGE
jgi:uncharacterized DUF497 family protein